MATSPADATIAADDRVTPPRRAVHIRGDIRASLDAEQIAWLEEKVGARTGSHAINYRVSTSFLGRRFYLTFLAGAEMRSLRRLQEEGQRRSFSTVAFEIGTFCFAVTLMLSTMIGMAFGLFWLFDQLFNLSDLPAYMDKLFH